MFDDLFQFTGLDTNNSDSGSNNVSEQNYVSEKGDVFGSSFGESSSSGFSSSNNSQIRPEDADKMIMPKAKPTKSDSDKPMVVVIDDDFATIDLMKIYLQREYEYISFDNPKEAIFFLNKCVPDLIFLDCYISIIKSKKVIEILKSYPEFENVPIYYLAESDELGAMNAKIENEGIAGISGILSRPVARGELQKVLDTVFKKNSA